MAKRFVFNITDEQAEKLEAFRKDYGLRSGAEAIRALIELGASLGLEPSPAERRAMIKVELDKLAVTSLLGRSRMDQDRQVELLAKAARKRPMASQILRGLNEAELETYKRLRPKARLKVLPLPHEEDREFVIPPDARNGSLAEATKGGTLDTVRFGPVRRKPGDLSKKKPK